MEVLKSILKIVGGLMIGILSGLLIAAVITVCFTDTTFVGFMNKLQSADFLEAIMAAAVGVMSFILAVAVLIPLHEAGHLVCGLLSGYKFVSFRIFNFTFIKKNGKMEVKKFSIAGTGGQCLLSPPDMPLEDIPTAWYNLGGILANILAALLVAPLLLIKGHPFLTEIIVVFLITDLFLILTNGIPMKIGGVGNDAYNMIALKKSITAKRGLINSLRSNALIQNGTKPADLPAEWFVYGPEINYSNDLEISIPLMAASRLVDKREYSEALKLFEELYAHKKEIIGLYVKEIECELVFLRLVCGDIDGARELLVPELRKYIEAYRKMMSSKERVLCAIALFMDSDVGKAREIYNTLDSRKSEYLLKGEVESDLAIMKSILDENQG